MKLAFADSYLFNISGEGNSEHAGNEVSVNSRLESKLSTHNLTAGFAGEFSLSFKRACLFSPDFCYLEICKRF